MDNNKADGITATEAKYPLIKEQFVTIRPRINKPLLPETGTTANAAEDYTQVLGGSFASFGSSRPLGRTLFTKDLEKQYLSELVGIAPSHVEWDKLLDNYWNNFYLPVPLQGVILNVSMSFDNAEDKEGYPVNVKDYVTWKYAMKHSWVANNIADVDKSPKIKFYLWTAGEDIVRNREALLIKDRAIMKRMELSKNKTAAQNVLLVMNMQVPTNMDELIELLVEVSEKQPTRFYTVATDKALTDKAFVERLIRVGIMSRPLNSTVVMYDGVAIGNSVEEAVAWLNRTDNAVVKETLRSSLKDR